MKLKISILTTTLLVFFCLGSLQAKTLTLGVGLSLPPYVIQSENAGIELDIIREALKVKGHTLKLSYLPFARIATAFSKGRIDCASTINEASGVKANYSDSHIYYQNVATTLKNKNLTINSLNDLKNKSIVSFQNATSYLGAAFATAVKNNPQYKEIADQKIQNKLLFKGRVQVVIGDINIFKYFTEKVSDVVDTTQPIEYHQLFPKTHFKVAFKDTSLMEEFNEGLAQIKANGAYQKIMGKYVK